MTTLIGPRPPSEQDEPADEPALPELEDTDTVIGRVAGVRDWPGLPGLWLCVASPWQSPQRNPAFRYTSGNHVFQWLTERCCLPNH